MKFLTMINEQWQKRLNRWFKLRFAIIYPFGVWAIISGYSTDKSIMHSIWFIVLGLGIRSWANCYAIKMEKLTTSGPYAYVRHPLYLGSFMIMVGFLIMLRVNWFISLLCVAVVIGIVYKSTIQKEEKMLGNKFGQEYIDYCRAVPPFLPTFFVFKKGEKWAPSFKRYFKSQEYKLFIWMIILIIAFHLKEEFLIEKEAIDIKSVILMIIAFLLGIADVVVGFFRKRIE
ncbi:MAG TPA: isoprenylcysteine carboxylmethyltransferase family protein [Candidatus Omnitrophota bacterium]|nr:isoprenylcysteine carboxylmethyltransferase family protein [Candidatus Omnitrophota bacterium]